MHAEYVLQFTRRFEAAHRFLMSDSPKCMSLHGHTWRVIVRLRDKNTTPRQPPTVPNRMLAEFGAVKAMWHRWVDDVLDHSVMLNEDDPLRHYLDHKECRHRITTTPGDPTTELIAALLHCKCNAFMRTYAPDLFCHEVDIMETPTNTVSLVCFDTPPGMGPVDDRFWWHRADMTSADD